MDGVHVLKGWTDPAMPSSARPDAECKVVDGSRFFPMTLEDIWAKIAFNVCWTHFTPTLSVTWHEKLSQWEESPQKRDLAPCMANQVTWHFICGSGQWRQTQQSMALACPSFWEVNKTRIVLVVVNKAFFSCYPTFFLCQLPLRNSAFSQYIKKIRDNMLHGGNFCTMPYEELSNSPNKSSNNLPI